MALRTRLTTVSAGFRQLASFAEVLEGKAYYGGRCESIVRAGRTGRFGNMTPTEAQARLMDLAFLLKQGQAIQDGWEE